MADNNTNINIKPSALVAGLGVLVVTILGWSLSIVYDNLVDEIHGNRERIKVQWALISANKEAINTLKVKIASKHTTAGVRGDFTSPGTATVSHEYDPVTYR